MRQPTTLKLFVTTAMTTAIFAWQPLAAQQSTITIDGRTGKTTQTWSRPPCQAKLDPPLPVTDTNVENYRFRGTCTAYTFASIRDLNDPESGSSQTAELSCKNGRFESEAVRGLDTLGGRKSKRLVVYVNDDAGLCTEKQPLEYRATYYANGADRPLPPLPRAALDNERAAEVKRVAALRPALAMAALDFLSDQHAAISLQREAAANGDKDANAPPSTAEQLACTEKALDLDSLNRREHDTIASVVSRKAIDLDTLRAIRTYLESDAGAATRERMLQSRSFMEHLKNGGRFEDFFKGRDANMEPDATKRAAMEKASAETTARNRETTDAFLKNPATAKAYANVTEQLSAESGYSRAVTHALRVAMKRCGVSLSDR